MRLNIMSPAVIACVCVVAGAAVVSAQEKTGASLAQAIAPIVDDQTFLIAHVDLRELDAGGALIDWPRFSSCRPMIVRRYRCRRRR